ncbi:MAG: dolichyl-phosphate beta-glucosyltransferase [Candidatus Melainabacteria bacterium]|jgi:dolichyl-phosphate beta-glucosyltransferase
MQKEVISLNLSIVIPCFNEQERLPKTLHTFFEFLNHSESMQNLSWEILIVDDGSSDRTIDTILQEFNEEIRAKKIKLLIQPHNMGKGASIRMGVLASVGEMILFSDADGSTPIAEFLKLKNSISSGVDVAIGSRHDLSLIDVKQPFFRILLGKTYNRIVRLLTGLDIQDTQCGFKLLRGDIGRKIFAQMFVNGFSFDVEMLYLAAQANCKIVEIPVIWANDERSKVVIWRDPFFMFLDLLRIKLKHG